jgi:hypothetical protein
VVQLIELFEKNVDWRVLSFFMKNPSGEYYIKQLSRILGVSPASVKNAVKRFKDLGMLHKEEKGQTHLFSLNNDSVLVKQLKRTYTIARLFQLNMVNKLLDIDDSIVSIALYGSYASGEYTSSSDLDLLIIGHRRKDFSPVRKELEEEFEIEVNVECLSFTDWNKLAKAQDPFYIEVVDNHILLFGGKL